MIAPGFSSSGLGTAPTGRGDLLEWLNVLCCAAYTSIEQLGDGVLYTQALEMGLPGDHDILSRLTSFDCCVVGEAESDAVEPTRRPSPALLTDRREKNLSVFQFACREYLPRRLSVEVNIPRLAQGKLQDHMILLKWLYSFVSSAAKLRSLRYVSDAEDRRARVAAEHHHRLCHELVPPHDAYVRQRRRQLGQALALLQMRKDEEPAAAAAPGPSSETPRPSATKRTPGAQQTPRGARRSTDYDAHNYSAEQHDTAAAGSATDQDHAEAERCLVELESRVVEKARRLEELQQHLRQFREMRDSLCVVSSHVRDEAVGVLQDGDRTRPDRLADGFGPRPPRAANPGDHLAAAAVVGILTGDEPTEREQLDGLLREMAATDPSTELLVRGARASCVSYAVLSEALADPTEYR